jgi:uncharacterized protein
MAAAGLMGQCVTPFSLTGSGSTQNFDSLASTGTGVLVSGLPSGWETNRTAYNTGTGSSNTGALYSFGAASSSERALGSVASGSTATIRYGFCLMNNTGGTITALALQYRGEQWRNGGNSTAHKLTFSYEAGATGFSGSGQTLVSALDFTGPIATTTAGALDGNATANSAAISHSITGLNLAPGQKILLQWADQDDAGNDHGLAIDDFSLTATTTGGTPISLSINDVSANEGNSGTTQFMFMVSASQAAPAGGLSFNYATANGTAIAPGDYTAASGVATISAGSNTTTITVLVNGDTTVEPDETFFVNLTNAPSGAQFTDAQGLGTILNDDVQVCPTTTISAVQGAGALSPVAGQQVGVEGIVTARKFNGYFVQTPDAQADGNPLSSEGLFVFTGSTLPSGAAVGNRVCVFGTVTEFATNNATVTELTNTSLTLLSTGNPLPAAVTLTASLPAAGGAFDQLERLEGMRVAAGSVTVTEGNTGTGFENGSFFGVLTGTAIPFREMGIEAPLGVPAPSSKTIPPIPRYDANSEILRIDTRGQGQAAPAVVATPGMIVSNITGVLDFNPDGYEILVDTTAVLSATPQGSYTAVPAREATQITVASFNLENYSGTATQQAKAVLAIRDVLRTPDVLGVQELINTTALGNLAAALNAAIPGAAYVHHTANTVGSNTQRVGYLVNTARVSVTAVTPVLGSDSYIVPSTGLPSPTHDRVPYLLEASAQTPGGPVYNFRVLNIHSRSLIDVSLDGATGNNVRVKRQQQAESLARYFHNEQTAAAGLQLFVIGDFNAFEFNDGYVDLLGTMRGVPVADPEVVISSGDLVQTDLVNLVTDTSKLPAAERFSYRRFGSRQVLDHMLATQAAAPRVAQLAYGRANAGFPEQFRPDATRPERLSDHDSPVAFVNLPNNPPVAGVQYHLLSPLAPLTVTLNVADPDGSPLTFLLVAGPAKGTATINAATRELTYTPGAGPLSGGDMIRYRATDLGGLSAEGTVYIVFENTDQTNVNLAGQFKVKGDETKSTGTLHLINTTKDPIAGPLHIVIDGLRPGVTVLNPSGVFQGKPYVTVPGITEANPLGQGRLQKIDVLFANPEGGPLNPIVTRVLSGTL